MIPGNIKLLVSIVNPCKWQVSQLFRNFDLTIAWHRLINFDKHNKFKDANFTVLIEILKQ